MTRQSISVPPLSSAAFFRRLLAAVAVLNLFVAALAALWLNHAREQDVRTARTASQNLAKVLEHNVAGTIRNIDLALLAVTDEYARHGRRIEGADLDTLLAQHLVRQPELTSLRMTDAQGTVRYGPGVGAGTPVNVADRDYFIAARDGTELAISKPLFARISKRWVVTLARRVSGPDGAFAGVVYANLALDRFTETFGALDVGPRGAVALRDEELAVVARFPEPEGVGSTVGNKAVSREFRALIDTGAAAGSYTAMGSLDNVQRVFSYRRVEKYPLYVVVGLAHDDFLAEWQREVAWVAALAALFFLVTLGAAWLLLDAWRRQATAAASLMQQEIKFHTLADHTYDWEYWQGADGREILYMTPSCERITGYAAEEFAANPGLLLDIVHPDDRAAMEDHLRGYAGHTEAMIDFRIVRRDGGLRWLAHACRPVLEGDGSFRGRRVGNRDITERKRIEEVELRLHESLRRLNEIATTAHLPLGDQLRLALKAGAEHLGLEIGIVSRIDGDTYEVVAQVSPPGMLADGQVFPFAVTYCAITLTERRVVAISQMGVSDYRGHPCYREFNLEAYIGAPVVVADAVFGTVNFGSRQAYPRPFDAADKEFVALLARWAGSAIERHRAEEALRQSEARLREAQRIAQLGSWELDLVSNKLSWSDEVFRIFEIEPTAFGASYDAFLATIHPDDRERVNLTYTSAVKNRLPYEMTHRLLMSDGNLKYVHEHCETFYDPAGRPLRSVGTVQDVTLTVLNEQAMRESEERFRTIADYTYDWEYWQGPQGEFLYISPSCLRVTGYSQGEFISRPALVYDIIHADDRHVMDDHLADIRHEDEGSLDFRIVRKDGGIRWIAHGCRAVYAKDGRFLGRRASNRDITDRKSVEEQVQQLAYFDTLTGLPNRRLLFDRLDRALSQAKRHERALAIMFLDLDNFKKVNDTLGHDVGDELLKEVAMRLETCVRSGDTVARQGGDEFIIVLAEVAEPHDAARVAEKIVAVLADPVTVADNALQVTTSIGIAVYPINGSDDIQELLKKADKAMYQAKAAGRNGYRFYAAERDEPVGK